MAFPWPLCARSEGTPLFIKPFVNHIAERNGLWQECRLPERQKGGGQLGVQPALVLALTAHAGLTQALAALWHGAGQVALGADDAAPAVWTMRAWASVASA